MNTNRRAAYRHTGSRSDRRSYHTKRSRESAEDRAARLERLRQAEEAAVARIEAAVQASMRKR